MSAEDTYSTVCALCGHEMTLERCGSAAVHDDTGSYPLCHHDDHDCYHLWTVYKKRRVVGAM